MSYPCRAAYRYPVCMAPPMPRLNGRLTTFVPGGTWRRVSSVLPSSITSTSAWGNARCSRRASRATLCRSLNAGTITRQRGRGCAGGPLFMTIGAAAWAGTVHLADPVTPADEAAAHADWQARAVRAGVTIGPRGDAVGGR